MQSYKCGSCGGCGFVDTWVPDYRTGGTIHTGAVRCLDCNGYGKAAQPVAIDLEAVNAELAAAAFYDVTGIEYGETLEVFIVETDWNNERRNAAHELATIDRVIGKHYAGAAGKARDHNAPHGKPDAAFIAPLDIRRSEIVEWWQHCLYMSAQAA